MAVPAAEGVEGVPVAVVVDAAQGEERRGTVEGPAHAREVAAVLGQVAAGPLDDAGGDGPAPRQVLVVAHVRGGPRSARVRCDWGGCPLYAGALVSALAGAQHGVPCGPTRRLDYPSPGYFDSGDASTRIHSRSPVQSFPCPIQADGSPSPWASSPALAPRRCQRRTVGAGTGVGHSPDDRRSSVIRTACDLVSHRADITRVDEAAIGCLEPPKGRTLAGRNGSMSSNVRRGGRRQSIGDAGGRGWALPPYTAQLPQLILTGHRTPGAGRHPEEPAALREEKSHADSLPETAPREATPLPMLGVAARRHHRRMQCCRRKLP